MEGVQTLTAEGQLSMNDKEILLLKKTYRKITQQYYENPSDLNAEIIVHLNELICQTISRKSDAHKLGILSTLEILKVKSKSNLKLSNSVQRIIDHLKNPTQRLLQFNSILNCFKQSELFAVGCMFGYLFYPKILRSQGVDWKEVIIEIGKRPSLNTDMCLQLLNILCKDNQGNAKHVVKSGVVKYIISCYLEQKLQEKYLLYKALKFLKLIANADRTVIRDRQKAMAKVVYTYDEYIPILQELCSKCYDEEYCQELYKKNKYESPQMDYIYVWSFNEVFAKGISSKSINEITKLLQKSSLNPEVETKLFAVMNNIVKFTGQNLNNLLQNPPKSLRAVLNYLKLVSTSVQNDPTSFQRVNLGKLQKLVSDDENPKSQRMFKYIQSLNSDKSNNKVSHINPKLLEIFSLDKNADILMQGAGKVPKNDEDLKIIKDILKKKQAHNEFQADLLNSVKGKALHSLSTAVIDRKVLDLNSLILEVDLNNIHVLAKILKLIEICLMMGHYQVGDFDKNRIFEIISWIENNYKGELIDWGSISQIIMIFEGEDAWMNHLSELPNQCFWLLGCIEIEEQNLDSLFKKLNSIFKSINKSSYKIALIIGFIGKILTRTQKTKAIEKLADYFKTIETGIKREQNWKINLYMSALFLFKWHDKSDSGAGKIFERVIQPVHTHIMKNFKSSEHEYKYLEACLPYKISVEKIVDNIDFLLSEYGNLASYVYQNSNPKPNINYDKISNISNAPHSAGQSILQILKFLKQNDGMIQGEQINRLFKKIIDNQQKYWQLYPNFVTIVNSILQIVSKTDNSAIIKNLTEILVDIINHIENNNEITPEQSEQILEEILKTLQTLSEKGTPLDIERLKRVSNKIQNQQIQLQIKKTLDDYKIIEKTPEPQKQNKSTRNVKVDHKTKIDPQVVIASSKNEIDDNKIGSQKHIQIPKFTETKSIKKPRQVTIQNSSSERNYMTTLQGTIQDEEVEEKEIDKEKQYLWIDDKEKNKVALQIKQLDNIQFQKNDDPTAEMTLTQALRKIKAMTEKKIPTTEFPKCVEVIEKCELQSNQKDILGHLLVLFYHIDQNPDVLDLLLEKDKTNLSKQACYQIVSKHVEAFILSDRWKLQGWEWMDIAVSRMSQQDFFSYACQVIEYNLIDIKDLQYFCEKKYHHEIVKNIHKVEDDQDAVFYLLLIGTCGRLNDIKKYFISEKLHFAILTYIDRWPSNYRITSNTFYALSSLVYSQPEICLEIVKKQQQMKKLLDSFRLNHQSKAVIQSGGCFIANMAYSNDEVKEVLRKYDVIEKLVFVFEKNLEDPQISTFKQLLRSLGNLSLSEKCAKQIIDSGFCHMEVKMIEVFNMFINLDETKLKLLKIAIDVFANLCSHKYNLPVMHKQNVTGTMIMLLETTQLNPPIIMGCIDTVDGLCQNPDIEAYSVNEKNLPYILIDILKIQEDEKIIVKATRLLTNLTINPKNIPNILEANLLSVLANIVMPSFFMKYNERTELNYLSNNPTVSTPPNKKMQMYINKIILRIHNSKPSMKLILKSGYLDCLVRTIETADNLEDIYIEILGSYAKGLPNFLNKRAFMCLIRVLTRKLKSKQTVEKCLLIFKTLLLRSYDKDEEDVVLTDTPMMYEILLQQFKYDTLYLLGLHCSISNKLRKILISEEKKYNIIPAINQLTQVEEFQQLANSVLFTIFNKDQPPKIKIEQDSEEKSRKSLSDGFLCELFRIDGTSKKAKIMMIQDNIVVFKHPDGQVKKKYTISLKNLRDWQFDYQKGSRQWKLSVFNKNKGMFSSQVPAQKCATMIGGTAWGQIAYINVEFNSKEEKQKFNQCLSVLILSLN